MLYSLCLLLAVTSPIYAAVLQARDMPPVHLAVKPNCGALSGNPASVNAGLPALSAFKAIISLGDSYTDGGVSNGSTLQPPVLAPPNPKAGGRPTNGPVWVENLASTIGAKLKDYAVSGAVIDSSIYPSGQVALVPDLVSQVNTVASQAHNLNVEPGATLYTIFFGMGDFVAGGDLEHGAEQLAFQLLKLSSSPVFAKNILVLDNYGRGQATPAGEAYKRNVFGALNTLQTSYGINVGYVDFAPVWDGVLGSSPGSGAFGYTNTAACLSNSSTTTGACADPDHAFYWFPGTPSAATHKMMSDYVQEVLTQCTA